MSQQRILILGATGMLGHALFFDLVREPQLQVWGTARSLQGLEDVYQSLGKDSIITGVDASHFDSIIRALATVQPDVVINCIGLIKHLPISGDPLTAIQINAELPHRLALICQTAGARLIHFSTDCVFDGRQGMYQESDVPTPIDLYGRTKLLGEVEYSHSLTLRTSIIGHELKQRFGLIEWFLAQKKAVHGYRRAIYSGFPTIEMARIVKEFILPRPDLSGIYHLATDPISKFDLLTLVSGVYDHPIRIEPDDVFQCDRSLNSDRFQKATGYQPPAWPELIHAMQRNCSENSRSDKQ